MATIDSTGGTMRRVAKSLWQIMPQAGSNAAVGGKSAQLSRPSPPPQKLGDGAHPPAPVSRRSSEKEYTSSRYAAVSTVQERQSSVAPVMLGYGRQQAHRYQLLDVVGNGGNATVRLANDKFTGKQLACKVIPKLLADPKASQKKKDGHINAIKREVEVMRRLRGALNVASLEEVFEDEDNVYILMEYCSGGELWHRIGDKHYSERTVASYMRAVLRTLAQCHANKILHRDIKPGNFMLLNSDDKAPLKAIDFGLAVPFDPAELPRSDLGLEGTPWYMAPEVLSSSVVPASDLWSAGVMAYQLLTGRFPFDDRKNPFKPSVAKVWQSILTDKLDLDKPYCEGLSSEARDFLTQLLQRDPAARPSAKQALRHPWLVMGNSSERSTGKSLGRAVVQRIQRFSQSSLFKRTVLEHIAADLLSFCPVDAPPVTESGDDAGIDPAELSGACHPQLTALCERLIGDSDLVDRDKFSMTLRKTGYLLTPAEVDRLLDQVDIGVTGRVGRSQFAASQLDWRLLQERNAEAWMESAERAFRELDADGDGMISTQEIMQCLRDKLPASEVDAAVQQALEEAGLAHPGLQAGPDADQLVGSPVPGIKLKDFITMLRTNSADSLDLYDDRMGSNHGSSVNGSHHNGSVHNGSQHGSQHGRTRLQLLLDRSVRGNNEYLAASVLDPVSEVAAAG